MGILTATSENGPLRPEPDPTRPDGRRRNDSARSSAMVLRAESPCWCLPGPVIYSTVITSGKAQQQSFQITCLHLLLLHYTISTHFPDHSFLRPRRFSVSIPTAALPQFCLQFRPWSAPLPAVALTQCRANRCRHRVDRAIPGAWGRSGRPSSERRRPAAHSVWGMGVSRRDSLREPMKFRLLGRFRLSGSVS